MPQSNAKVIKLDTDTFIETLNCGKSTFELIFALFSTGISGTVPCRFFLQAGSNNTELTM
jgi:hypothetical protein